MVGYDPDKDYLLDPQQKKDKFPRCKVCRRQIFYGEVFYDYSGSLGDGYLCSDCFAEIERSASIMEDCYV